MAQAVEAGPESGGEAVTARNLHRIVGALDKARRDAASGQCVLHPDRDAVGYIESWDLHPRGICELCATKGAALGYTVHPVPAQEVWQSNG